MMRKILLSLLLFGSAATLFGQTNSQYTQYMYNTEVVNPAYTASKDAFSAGLLYRTQWVGLDGAPKTATFSADTPVGSLENMGLGLTIIHDEIGPSEQTFVSVNYSYVINLTRNAKLSFGLNAGVDVLNVDFTKLNAYNPNDPYFDENIDNRWQPQMGAGAYYYTDRFYAGLSVPNFLETKHFDSSDRFQAVASERMHFYLISGYVFDLSHAVKFKPATMLKAVKGAPLQWDVSANFLIHEKLTLGTAYRWDAAVSALAGFQINPNWFIGVGYDYQLSDLEKYSDGSYEIILRFSMFNPRKSVLTPRFF